MSTNPTRPTRTRNARNFTLALPDARSSFASTSAYTIHSDDEENAPKLVKKKSVKKVGGKSKVVDGKERVKENDIVRSPVKKVAKKEKGKKISKGKGVEERAEEEIPVDTEDSAAGVEWDEVKVTKAKKSKQSRKVEEVDEAPAKQEKVKSKRRKVDIPADEAQDTVLYDDQAVESVHLHVDQSVIDGAWRPLADSTKESIISELDSLIPPTTGKSKSKYNFGALLEKVRNYFNDALVPAPSLATRKSGNSKSKIEIYVGQEIEEQIVLLQSSLPAALAQVDKLSRQ